MSDSRAGSAARSARAAERVAQQAGASDTFWRSVWRQFRRNRIAFAGYYVVLLLLLIALSADFLANDRPLYLSYKGSTYFPILRGYLVDLGAAAWPPELLNVDYKRLENAKQVFPPVPYRQTSVDLFAPLEPPSWKHWLGTDRLGRDVMAGMIHGSRISLSIGFVAVGIALVIGVILGALAGYFGSWIDIVISRLFEIMLSIPTFFLLITVAAIFRPSIFMTMVIIGLTSWVGIARFTRSEFLRIRNLDYVTAAISIGVSNRKVMFQHILPNALAPVIVSVVLGIAGAILVESSLSFLGIGVPAQLVTWGSILNEASGATSGGRSRSVW